MYFFTPNKISYLCVTYYTKGVTMANILRKKMNAPSLSRYGAVVKAKVLDWDGDSWVQVNSQGNFLFDFGANHTLSSVF